MAYFGADVPKPARGDSSMPDDRASVADVSGDRAAANEHQQDVDEQSAQNTIMVMFCAVMGREANGLVKQWWASRRRRP